MKEYAGKVRLVYKDLPLRRHPLARSAHEAARCAGASGRYWAYHDRLYANQPSFDRARLLQYAAEIGLDPAAFARCLDRREFAQEIDEDIELAIDLGIHATPTFVVVPGKLRFPLSGPRLVGARPIENFRAAIDDALKALRK